MTDPLFDIVLALHVGLAFVGFGALGATGTYARLASRTVSPFESAALLRFFRPGHNLAARAIYLVPVAGLTLLALNSDHDASALWPWIGLGLWGIAVSATSGLMWPAERAMQRLFMSRSDPENRLMTLARRLELGGAVCSLCFVAAFVVMIAQPN